ncbi:MAG: 50S ribosomal protein L4 [Candidatus Hydrothermarchaeota archaeon]
MIANVYSLKGEKKGEIELPAIFKEDYRPDLIKRAVISSITARIQPWGTDPRAGKRTTAESRGAGFGIARVRRIKGRGYHAAYKAAFVPQAVGGRRAHPPKVNKKIHEKINKREKKLAIRSAIAATKDYSLVSARGHRIEGVPELPLVVEDRLESINKTKKMKEVLQALGVWQDVERAKRKKIRAGKGKMRGRKYKKPKGPLIVINKDKGVKRASRNLAGVDVVTVKNLGIEDLAPGTHAGRLTLWTKSAIKNLGDL